MIRFVLLMVLTANVYAAEATVDIDTAAKIYQAASIREQVRASLSAMPGHIRQLFAADTSAQLSEPQLAAVSAAAVRGFRLDVFEAPALQSLANHLDPATVTKTEAFFASDLGKRVVSADVALATLGEANIDKVMNGEITAPTTPKRDEIVDKLERATRSTESTVDIFLSMGQAVAVGTAVGSGLNPAAVEDRAHKSGESSRPGLEANMRLPMRRFMAYGYRDLSDADLKKLLAFMESPAGKHYIAAYNASMEAGFDAMGHRTGEQLGESLRELAQANLATPPTSLPPASIAAPPALPH
jgi:Uncharacterized protein conserved in bacteria (DUF2059)